MTAITSAVLRPPPDRFPPGTVVGAYRGNAWSGADKTVAPTGAADVSATVAADGSLTFAGLTDQTAYHAWAAGTGPAVRFTTRHDYADDISSALAASSGAARNVFTPEGYGARRDGRVLNDATIVGGQATTLNSASAPFRPADVGKRVVVQNAATAVAAAAQALSTTIVGYVSPTQVTLALGADIAVANVLAVYGTDDTAALQAAVNAAAAAAQADGSGYAEVQFSAGIYVAGGAPVVGAPTLGNAQITLPVVAGTVQKVTLALLGPRGSGDALAHWAQTTAQASGAMIFSTRTLAPGDAANGTPSIIGGPTPEKGYGNNSTFSNMLVRLDGLSVGAPQDPTLSGFDLRGVGEVSVGRASAIALGNLNTWPLPANGAGSASVNFATGLLMPVTGNNALCNVESWSAQGWYCGLGVGEHSTVTAARLINCRVGLWTPAASGNPAGGAHVDGHGAAIVYLNTEACRIHIYGDPTFVSAGNQVFGLQIVNWDIEDDPAPFTTTYHLYDPNSRLRGDINFQQSSITGNIAPVINTAATGPKARVRDMIRAAGQVPALALGATGVAIQNTHWRDAAVTISGGTVTAITVDGQALGVTAGTVIVPAGKQIAVTYTVAPTWVWTLL